MQRAQMAKRLAVVVAGVVMIALAACGSSSGPQATSDTQATSPGGTRDGWIDPGTSLVGGPGPTATPTPTDCTVASLETVLWRGWESAGPSQTKTLVVEPGSVRLTADGTFAVFDYHDTQGKMSNGTILADCGQGFWQLARVLDGDFPCSEAKSRYTPRFYAAIVELGACDL